MAANNNNCEGDDMSTRNITWSPNTSWTQGAD